MTAYKNFVDDFPQRCRDVLEIAVPKATLRGREVTLLLMVASTGFVIPYERLKLGDEQSAHPSLDVQKFPEAANRLSSLMESKFLSSDVWGPEVSTWGSGTLKSINGDPDAWKELQNPKFSSNKTVNGVLRVIRNALAHGNIFTRNNPVQSIVFLSVKTDDHSVITGFRFVCVSPDDFRIFLEKWFDFLKNSSISQREVSEVLKDAA